MFFDWDIFVRVIYRYHLLEIICCDFCVLYGAVLGRTDLKAIRTRYL